MTPKPEEKSEEENEAVLSHHLPDVDRRSLAHTVMRTLTTAREYAGMMRKATLLPPKMRETEGNVILVMEASTELGIGFATAAQTFYVVDGKLSMSADQMVALARRAGHDVRYEFKGEGQDTEVTCIVVRQEDRADHRAAKADLKEQTAARIREKEAQGKQHDPATDPVLKVYRDAISELEYRVTWTSAEVKTAGLGKKPDANHNKYPRPMRRHRAGSECIRMACGEVLGAYRYIPEELGARVNEGGIPLDGQTSQDGTHVITTVEREDRPHPAPASAQSSPPKQPDAVKQQPAAQSNGAPRKRTAQDYLNIALKATTVQQVAKVAKAVADAGCSDDLVQSPRTGRRTLRAALSVVANELKQSSTEGENA